MEPALGRGIWVCPGDLACVAWRVCVVLCALSMLEMCLSSRGVCQHGFVRGQLRVTTSLSGAVQRCGLCADCHLWASFFSWRTFWKHRMSCWQGTLCQGVESSRFSSLCCPARCHTTRLETRTKESIHMCEYVSSKLVCVMKVTVGT